MSKGIERAARIRKKQAETEEKKARLERRKQLLSTPAAAELLGITAEQFRALAKRLGWQPEDEYENPHSRRGQMCPLWAPENVRSLVGGQEIAAIKQRTARLAEAKATKPARRLESLTRRFPRWRDAIPAAAEAMFNLNRYAKWKACTNDHKNEIYHLKNRFVCLLYEDHLDIGARLHTIEREGASLQSL